MPPFRQTLGVLGGGQLGRMLCEAASPINIPIIILDAEGSPAKQVNGHPGHITGSFKDPVKIRELARKCDYLTVEIEHVDADVLEEISTTGVKMEDGTMKVVPVHPAPRTLKLIQDKFLQKEHLWNNDIPISQQIIVSGGTSTADLEKGIAATADELGGFPFMLKARNGSYDGRGNFAVPDRDAIPKAAEEMVGLNLYAEKWVPFKMELSVMVMRTEDDNGSVGVWAYPCVETIHEESICTKVYWPPRGVSQEIQSKAQEVARKVVETFWGRGVFAVEMFLLEDNTILVNEVAPRPHNSGHYTIEAVPQMSQYKAQLYSVFNILPSPTPSMFTPRVSSAIMINILGGRDPTSHIPIVVLADDLIAHPKMDIFPHLYGKEPKPGRKIGHITVTGHGVECKELESCADGFIEMVDEIATERKNHAAPALRPTAPPTTATTDAAPTVVSTTTAAAATTATAVAVATEAAELASSTPTIPTTPSTTPTPLVAVTMGSDSDLKVLAPCLQLLKTFNIPHTATITSAHRTPNLMTSFATAAAARGIKVIIAAAGGAAHLPGMLASHTPLPVIGVPVAATHLDGKDSLLSIVQMPRGVPVATVGINNGTNAALLAVRILGGFMGEYRESMVEYQKEMERVVEGKAGRLEEVGFEEYLEGM